MKKKKLKFKHEVMAGLSRINEQLPCIQSQLYDISQKIKQDKPFGIE